VSEPILGLEIGETKTAVVLGDHSGMIHDRLAWMTRRQRGFPAAFEELCAEVDELRRRAERDGRSASVLSVSIGGPLEIERGRILSPPNLPGWDDIPLRDLLQDRFGLAGGGGARRQRGSVGGVVLRSRAGRAAALAGEAVRQVPDAPEVVRTVGPAARRSAS